MFLSLRPYFFKEKKTVQETFRSPYSVLGANITTNMKTWFLPPQNWTWASAKQD